MNTPGSVKLPALRLTTLPPAPCSYFSDRQATFRAFQTTGLSPELYHDLMDAGFRRSGRMIYQPICVGCQQCVPIRVPVRTFQPSKSQRRCAAKNSDLHISDAPPQLTDEKFDLYRRYISGWHDRPGGEDPITESDLRRFLYESPVSSVEFTYRTSAGQLLAVGICDVSQRALSSVYFYFDPAHSRRSLGTFGVLHELAWAAAKGIEFLYLGFWVKGCRKMEYKSNFGPCELLGPAGWHGQAR